MKSRTILIAALIGGSLSCWALGVLPEVNGEIIGAIGVGGARGSENDEACALGGVKKIQGRQN
jgi:uncharacterized protein GlcG (DUF336 family)